MRIRILSFVIAIAAAISPNAYADDQYYMIVLTSQAEPNLPKLSHTFAVFAKASGEGKDFQKYKLETHTISWLPRSLSITPLRVRPEPGHNLNLLESLKYAESINARVSYWGPFPIKKNAYYLALKQIEVLNSGKVGYIVLDRRFRGNGATNCIHAVSDLDTEQPLLETGKAYGEEASRMVLQHLQRWIVPSEIDHSWVLERLNLKKDSRRDFELKSAQR